MHAYDGKTFQDSLKIPESSYSLRFLKELLDQISWLDSVPKRNIFRLALKEVSLHYFIITNNPLIWLTEASDYDEIILINYFVVNRYHKLLNYDDLYCD